jgi:hypothetical protein
MRSTRKAQPSETMKHQIVKPPLISAWSEPLFILLAKFHSLSDLCRYFEVTYFVMPIVSNTAAR